MGCRVLSLADLDAAVYRCPQCGAWVLPRELMRAEHACGPATKNGGEGVTN